MIRTVRTPGGLSLLGTFLPYLLPFPSKIRANEVKPCYAPNSERIDGRFMPCINMKDTESVCCRINDTDPDICKPNGLCYWENTGGGGKEGPYRGLCTCQDWDTPNCLPKTMCDDDAGGRSNYTGRLHDCHDDRYCCGDSSACCTDDNMFTISPTLIPIGSSSSTNTTSTVTATVSGKEDSSSKVAIGLGMGIPLFVLAIAGAGGGFLWGRRSVKVRYGPIQNQGYHMPLGVFGGGGEVHQADSKSVHEADIIHPFERPQELPARRNDH